MLNECAARRAKAARPAAGASSIRRRRGHFFAGNCNLIVRQRARSYLHDAPSDRRSVSVVLGEEILIQTFELDCPAGADSDPMLNHEVCQVLAIEQDDTLG